jgi:ABC-type Fe3+ transport system permease subunit
MVGGIQQLFMKHLCVCVCFFIVIKYSYVCVTILREIGWDGMDWMNLAQDRDQWRALVNTVMKLRVP